MSNVTQKVNDDNKKRMDGVYHIRYCYFYFLDLITLWSIKCSYISWLGLFGEIYIFGVQI
jgi:hypothetical protein